MKVILSYKHLFFLLMLSWASVTSSAQTMKQYLKAGDKAYLTGDYNAALQYYQSAWKFDTSNMEIVYRLGESARMYFNYDLAEKYYTKVFFSEKRPDFPLVKYYWAQVMKSKGEYETALRLFQQFVDDNTPGAGEYITLAGEEVKNCRWAMDIISNAGKEKVGNMGKQINSPYSEFGAYPKGDTFYYSSYRFEYKNDKNVPNRLFTKILASSKGGRGNPIKKPFNEDGLHTAHTAFSPDNRRIYYTECQYLNGTRIQCQLFYRELDKKNRWGEAQKLPFNAEGATNTEPAIGFDTLCGCQYLYFVSDRTGGMGKLDLWRARINSNDFGEPENLQEINTPENDITPFFQSTTGTLFFSTDGRKSLGGYDIYQTKLVEGHWMSPENTGYPTNSSYNDVYYAIDEAGEFAYLSSNRPGSQFLDPKNKNCCYDIYRIEFEKEVPSVPVPMTDTTYVGIPPLPLPPPVIETKPPAPKIPEKLEDFLPLALYFDNDEPDKRTVKTTTSKSYEQTFLPYYDAKSTFVDQFTTPLVNEEKEAATAKIEDFFENEVNKGYQHINLFSAILLKRLLQGDTVEIFIKGYTSPRAAVKYNEALASRRIESVKNHFRTYENGIFAPYIKSRQLILSEKPFGEITASKEISDDINDRRNSVYSVRASKERRVEIVEVR